MERQDLDNITSDITDEEQLVRDLMKQAMKSHLEARQAEDLRRDLAQNLRPTEGPFQPGDKVYFWDKKFSDKTTKLCLQVVG